jgi:hypothetical protein
MLVPLVVAHNCFGSHTRRVTLVRSVPMYLSCVIAQVPLVSPKTPCIFIYVSYHVCISVSQTAFVSYAVEMCFSHMLLSPWYSRYEVMTFLVMLMRCIAMLLVAFGCICLWMASFCKNSIWSSLVCRMPLMFKLGAYGYILLNLCLEPCSFYLGSKIHLSSWMFSVHASLWRSLSFFLPQRHFMYHA